MTGLMIIITINFDIRAVAASPRYQTCLAVGLKVSDSVDRGIVLTSPFQSCPLRDIVIAGETGLKTCAPGQSTVKFIYKV